MSGGKRLTPRERGKELRAEKLCFSFHLSFFPLATEGSHPQDPHKAEDSIRDYPDEQHYMKTTILKDKLTGIVMTD